MGRFGPGKRIGLRDWVSMHVIAVYPYAPAENDEETERAVRDWFYEQDCDAENRLSTSFVDVLSDEEAASLPDVLAASGSVDETEADTAAGAPD